MVERALWWVVVMFGVAAAWMLWFDGLARAAERVQVGGPLAGFAVTADLGCEVAHASSRRGEFYGGGACVTALATDGGLFTPAAVPAAATLTAAGRPFAPVDQRREGDGAAAGPHTVITTVRAGALTLVQTDRAVPGVARLWTEVAITNPTDRPVGVRLFRAGDCLADDADTGFGQIGPGSAACVSAVRAHTVRYAAEGGGPPPRALQGFYDDIWQRIASFAPGGGPGRPFDDTCRCAEDIDNGAGLQWDLTVGPGATATVASRLEVGPIARPGALGHSIGPRPGGSPYVALGDSFSSGEGAGSARPGGGHHYRYRVETDLPGNRCHRSENAYPALLAARLAARGWPGGVDFRACSGAVIADLHRANPRHRGEGPQAAALGGDTRLATITIGGNDAGFAQIIRACVVGLRGCQVTRQGAAVAARQRLDSPDLTAPGGLLATYRRLIERMPADGRVAVFGYPDLAPVGRRCATALAFSTAERAWLQGWIDTFNGVIRRRALQAGAEFIDVAPLFRHPTPEAHRPCARREWINGLRRDGLGVAAESFHPNRLGHRAYAAAAADHLTRRGGLAPPPPSLMVVGRPSPARSTGRAEGVGAAPAAMAGGHEALVVRRDRWASLAVAAPRGRLTTISLAHPQLAIRLRTVGGDGRLLSPGAEGGGVVRVMRFPGVSAVELRPRRGGVHHLSVRLAADSSVAAGVISVRVGRMREVNRPPLLSVVARVDRAGRLDASAAASIDPEGEALVHRWRPPGAGWVEGPRLRHRFPHPGRRRVLLVVRDRHGATARQVLLVDTRPQRTIGVSWSARPGGRTVAALLRCRRAVAVGACTYRARLTAVGPGGDRRGVERHGAIAPGGRARVALAAGPGAVGVGTRLRLRLHGADEVVRPGPGVRAFRHRVGGP